MIRSLLVVCLAILAFACTSAPPPQPTLSAPPTGQPSGSPVPTGAQPSGVVDGVTGDVTQLLAPDGQPALPGLYVPAGTRVRGTDHYAFVQASMSCDELAGVLGAGEWKATERLSPPMPSADPSAGLPEIPPVEWIVLRWAEDRAIARLGGDETSCVAQVWRLARVPYAASGAYESAGEAMQYQLMCVAGGGGAQLGAVYFALGGLLYSISAAIPLELGSHPVDIDTEISAGQSDVEMDHLLRALFTGDEEAGVDEDAVDSFFPADFESGEWEGSVEVTSIEPLTGEIVLQDMRDEAGRSLELRSGFRCDLPPGQLTRAAEEQTDDPDEPSPSPAPESSLTIDIASGAHAGSHSIDSAEISCSFGILGDEWFVAYSPPGDPIQDELQGLTISVPAGGGKSSVFMMFGDDIEADWFNSDDATAEVTDNGETAEILVAGSEGATDFDITISCGAVERI